MFKLQNTVAFKITGGGGGPGTGVAGVAGVVVGGGNGSNCQTSAVKLFRHVDDGADIPSTESLCPVTQPGPAAGHPDMA